MSLAVKRLLVLLAFEAERALDHEQGAYAPQGEIASLRREIEQEIRAEEGAKQESKQ